MAEYVVLPTAPKVLNKCQVLVSNSVTLAGNVITIALPDVTTLKDKDVIKFVIAQPFPDDTPLKTSVVLKVNGTTIPLRCKLGEELSAARQLRTRMCYYARLAASVPQFLLCNNVCPNGIVQPSFSPSASETPTTGGSGTGTGTGASN